MFHDRSQKSDRSATRDSPVEMTSMVDVTFLLLIFFMVTAAFQLQSTLPSQPPRSDLASPGPPEIPREAPLIVDVTATNTFWLQTEERELSVASAAELIRQLRDANTSDTATGVLLVRAHEESLHEVVVSAIDAGRRAGMREIQLQTTSDP